MKHKHTWPQKSVIYQIYPRSFKDSNYDGIGDIKGIIEKLDYLKYLGIDALWISPMYKSPMKDFGYDVSDYCDIESMFGTLNDFDNLVKQAHKRDLKIIMDYIPSHTSTEHPWFLESKSSKDNPKRNWYIWKDPKPDGSPPNNWLSVFGGSRWEFDQITQQFYLHTFLKEQADLNWRNSEVQEAMFAVLRFWLERGVDGFRVDAFDHMIKDEQFLDEPANPDFNAGQQDPFESQLHIYTTQQPELYEFIKKFGKILAEYGEKFLITESYVDIPYLVKLYHAGNILHAPFNFQFISLPWNAQAYKAHIDEFDRSVGQQYLPTYVLGNHDRHRVATRVGEDGARVATMLQLTLRGIPTIYYGEEIGMQDGTILPDKVQDPFEKQVPGIGLGRDPERTPMQWNAQAYAGFSDVAPWLPIAEGYKTYNVEKESHDEKSMLSLYKQLLTLRKQSKALLYGTYASLDINNESIFAYIREYQEEKILVVLNFSNKKQTVTLPFEKGEIILNTYLDKEAKSNKIIELLLRSDEGYILKV